VTRQWDLQAGKQIEKAQDVREWVYVGGDIKGGGKGIMRNSKAVRLRCNESRTSGMVDYMKIVYSVTAATRERDNGLHSIHEESKIHE
jgi:hypothetical protein